MVKSSHIITENIEVGVPADEAFAIWTEYDKWSQIFKKESASTDGDRAGERPGADDVDEVKVRAKIGPSERQWTAQILSTDPGRRVNWRSKGPLQAMGTTSFHRLDDRLTRIMVEVEYQPSGALETIGNFFRMQRRRVRRDLRLFKNYAELRHIGPEQGDQSSDGGTDDEAKESSR